MGDYYERSESKRGGGLPALPDVPKWVAYVAILAFGLLVMFGGITTAVLGLPFASKSDLEATKEQLHLVTTNLVSLTDKTVTLSTQLAILVNNVGYMQGSVKDNGDRIERLREHQTQLELEIDTRRRSESDERHRKGEH